MFIPDPNFFHPGSRFKKIPDPGSDSASKNLSILTPNCSEALGNMIRFVHPGSDPDFLPIPDPGVKKSTGFRIRIRNTANPSIVPQVNCRATLFRLTRQALWPWRIRKRPPCSTYRSVCGAARRPGPSHSWGPPGEWVHMKGVLPSSLVGSLSLSLPVQEISVKTHVCQIQCSGEFLDLPDP